MIVGIAIKRLAKAMAPTVRQKPTQAYEIQYQMQLPPAARPYPPLISGPSLDQLQGFNFNHNLSRSS